MEYGFAMSPEAPSNLKGRYGLPFQGYQQGPSWVTNSTYQNIINTSQGETQVVGDPDAVAQQFPGPPGPPGNPGPIGNQGSSTGAGSTGPAGPDGAVGPQGAVGPEGEKGIDGPQGEDGVDGNPGPQGAVGPQGNTGPQGEDGAVGASVTTGPVGLQGPKGAQGDTGGGSCDCCIGPETSDPDVWVKFPKPLIPPPTDAWTNTTGNSLAAYIYYKHPITSRKYLIDVVDVSPDSTNTLLAANIYTDFTSSECTAIGAYKQGIVYDEINNTPTDITGSGFCACANCETLRAYNETLNDSSGGEFGEYKINSAGIYIVEDLNYRPGWDNVGEYNEAYNLPCGNYDDTCEENCQGGDPQQVSICNQFSNSFGLGGATLDCEDRCWPQAVIEYYRSDGTCCRAGNINDCVPVETVAALGSIPGSWSFWADTGEMVSQLNSLHGSNGPFANGTYSLNLNCSELHCDGNLFPAGHSSSTQDCGEIANGCYKDDMCCPSVWLSYIYQVYTNHSRTCAQEDNDLPVHPSKIEMYNHDGFFQHPHSVNYHYGNIFTNSFTIPSTSTTVNRSTEVGRDLPFSQARSVDMIQDTYAQDTIFKGIPAQGTNPGGPEDSSRWLGAPFSHLVLNGNVICKKFKDWEAGTLNTYSSAPTIATGDLLTSDVGVLIVTEWDETKVIHIDGWPTADPYPQSSGYGTGAAYHNNLPKFGIPQSNVNLIQLGSSPADTVFHNFTDIFYRGHWTDGAYNGSSWLEGAVKKADGTVVSSNPSGSGVSGSQWMTTRFATLFPDTSRDKLLWWHDSFGTNQRAGMIYTFTEYTLDGCCI